MYVEKARQRADTTGGPAAVSGGFFVAVGGAPLGAGAGAEREALLA